MKKLPLLALGALIPAAHADQVINDDLVVSGSAVVGLDGVNGESFGFDTIRLKENNLRLHFQDTSVSASFPSTDWRIVANDSGNGGANYLAFEDSDTGRQSFRVEAGAPASTLYVEADGDVGIKTDNPVVDLHVVEGNTPTLRLEQDGSDGFTPQTWDLAGNESNFFVRDVTNGSRLSFRIRPGAPESSIDVAGDGDIGLGTSSPSGPLHVRRTSASAKTMLELENNGAAALEIENTTTTGTASVWNTMVTDAGTLMIQKTGDPTTYTFEGGGAFVIEDVDNKFTYSSDGLLKMTRTVFGNTTELFDIDGNGNLVVSGTVMGSSDVNRKENFSDVDTSEILENVAKMPIKNWNYKGETIGHIGPMAQDFWNSFKLGANDRSISMVDADGIAIASIQELHSRVQEKDAKIQALEERINRLEKLLTE